MNTPFRLLTFILCLLTLLSQCQDKHIVAANNRSNALAKLYPSLLSGLDVPSQKIAVDYATLWMKGFSVLGTSGLSQQPILKSLFEKELMPVLLPLKGGPGTQNEAFEAGMKIHEAISYLGTNLREKKPFENTELNALLRYQPGHESNPILMSEGIAELFYDYIQLANPAAFAIDYKPSKQHKSPNP